MINNNYYPVKFKEFLRIKSTGNYIINYAILDDRIHFEMPIENSVYVSQRFLLDIEEEIKAKASNFASDPIIMFLKMTLSGNTYYRYYPTSQMIIELKKIKLYQKIIVRESKPGIYDKDTVTVIEGDNFMKAMDGSDVVLFGEKE